MTDAHWPDFADLNAPPHVASIYTVDVNLKAAFHVLGEGRTVCSAVEYAGYYAIGLGPASERCQPGQLTETTIGETKSYLLYKNLADARRMWKLLTGTDTYTQSLGDPK